MCLCGAMARMNAKNLSMGRGSNDKSRVVDGIATLYTHTISLPIRLYIYVRASGHCVSTTHHAGGMKLPPLRSQDKNSLSFFLLIFLLLQQQQLFDARPSFHSLMQRLVISSFIR